MKCHYVRQWKSNTNGGKRTLKKEEDLREINELKGKGIK